VTGWKVEQTADGLRCVPVTLRRLGSEELTWANLLYVQLAASTVFVLYFPSRFDLDVDAQAREALTTFGRATGEATRVNFWDATDPEFSRALGLFDVIAPPALVLARGLKLRGKRMLDPAHLYAIAITDADVLSKRERLAAAVNTAHEVLARGDAAEISAYVRKQSVTSLLQTLSHIGETLVDGLVRLKPKVTLPGGPSIQLGD
jgi:hypothetical protein